MWHLGAIPILFLVAALSGCVDTGPKTHDDPEDSPAQGGFRIPPIRVGDTLRYAFQFGSGDFSAGGLTDLKVVERASVADASGTMRDALLITQESPDSDFGESYWVDASTMRQFKLMREEDYQRVARMPSSTFSAFPMKATSYANGTGPLERWLEDPVFEDANFFGLFATDRVLEAGQALDVSGYLWARNTTNLADQRNWTGKVTEADPDETWGPLRKVEFSVDHRLGNDFETIAWTGAFSQATPFAVDMLRVLKAQFGSRTYDLRFNATLLAYAPGEGEPVPRATDPAPRPLGAMGRAAAERWPAEGSGPALAFPFKEAMDALALDPTAKQYFDAHAGNYVRYAHLEEVDTCGAYGTANPPLCHWYSWFGIFSAPDDFQLTFYVEKYAGSGAGAAFVPPVPRDYVFDTVFELPSPPEAPEASVVMVRASGDLLARATFPMESATFASAIERFQAAASPTNAGRLPNMVAFYMTPIGYAWYLEDLMWVFPPNPELFVFYDEMPMDLPRHSIGLDGEGHLLESRNYDVVVTHR